jgi:protein SCO1
MMNRALLFAPLLVLAACQPPAAPPPLAGARIGGPFTLTDQNGQQRSDRDFAGKYRIMYFGYAYCPDVCPVDVRNLSAGHMAFAKDDPAAAKRVVPIFVTVDPERDTPQVLRNFIGAFGNPALIGLTGTTTQVEAVTKAYGVAFQLNKEPGQTDYLVDHSRAAYLMDPDGKPIALLSQDAKPEVIAGELEKWVK